MGALKAALTAIFNAHGDANLTSSMKVPYFDSSNNPYGLSSMSALASVLCETTNSVSSYTDFNSITTSGQYVFSSTQITGKEHAPSESAGCLLVLGGSMIRQIYFENSSDNKVFIRKNFASQGWSAWVRL